MIHKLWLTVPVNVINNKEYNQYTDTADNKYL